MAAKAIAGAVRTTLGPRGMDKMLVSSTGDIVITNDGATILNELSVQHPGAKMMVEVARTQDDQVGDGTTTAVVIAGALMEQAEKLLEMGIHPTVISEGYRLGMEKGLEIASSLSFKVDPADRKTLIKVADTAITGKSIESVKEKLDGIIVDAVMAIAEKTDGKYSADEDDLLIRKKKGKSIDDSELIRGIILDKTRVTEGMPKKVNGAKVALIAMPLEITKTQVKAKIKITTAEQISAFSEQERAALRKLADSVISSGANVVLCQKGIADPVQFFLAKYGVYAVEDVPEKDLKYAARALNANIVNKPEDLTAKDLGIAEVVDEDDDMEITRISGCRNPKTVSILLRGTSDYLLDELERAVVDGTRVVMDAIEDGTVRGRWRCSGDRAPDEVSGITLRRSGDGYRWQSRDTRRLLRSSPALLRRTPGTIRSISWSPSRTPTRKGRRRPASTSTLVMLSICSARECLSRSGPSASPSRAHPRPRSCSSVSMI